MPDNPLSEMMSKITGMRQKMEEAAENAAKRTATATVGGGMVSATANGKQEIVRITIDPQALTDKGMLEDLIAAAVNQAVAQTRDFVQEEIKKVAGDLGMPLGIDLSKFF